MAVDPQIMAEAKRKLRQKTQEKAIANQAAGAAAMGGTPTQSQPQLRPGEKKNGAPAQTAPVGGAAPSPPKSQAPTAGPAVPPSVGNVPRGTPGVVGTEVKAGAPGAVVDATAGKFTGAKDPMADAGSDDDASEMLQDTSYGDVRADAAKEQAIKDAKRKLRGMTEAKAEANKAAGIDPMGGTPTGKDAAGGKGDEQSDFDKAVADLLMGEVKGARSVDTKEEEDLIRQQMEDALAQQLQDSAARAGRAGFAASGAQQALEGDLMRSARQQGLEDVLGLRRTEDQRAKDNANRAIGSDIDMRKQAEDEFFNNELLNTLKSSLGIDGDDAGAGEDGGFAGLDGSLPTPKDIGEGIVHAVGGRTEAPELAASNSQIKDGEPGTFKKPKKVDKAPAGAVRGNPFPDGTHMYTLRHDDNGGWTEYFRAP